MTVGDDKSNIRVSRLVKGCYICYKNAILVSNWLYVLIMPRKHFRVNPHSIVSLMCCLNIVAWIVGLSPDALTSTSDFAPASSKKFLDIQAAIESGFTLKCVRGMIRTYNQTHCTDKHSQHSSIIWPIWLNGWVFIYELRGCGFESSYSHLDLRYWFLLEIRFRQFADVGKKVV